MKSQYFRGCCCLETGLCGGVATLFNLMRRDKKGEGLVSFLEELTCDLCPPSEVEVWTIYLKQYMCT